MTKPQDVGWPLIADDGQRPEGPMDCTCCGETIAQVPPEGEWSCACEWDGCDESCPIVGHLYREQAR